MLSRRRAYLWICCIHIFCFEENNEAEQSKIPSVALSEVKYKKPFKIRKKFWEHFTSFLFELESEALAHNFRS